MKTIYKFPIRHTIEVPKNARLLKIGIQKEDSVAWYELDTTETEYRRDEYYVIGTGRDMEDYEDISYIDTLFQGDYVWHVYKLNHE